MQKNAYKIIALTLLLMLLCGCKQSRSLGERAIVKMVYLDESGGQVQAGLVVFTCAPNSDTASVEGQAKIYTAQGKSIEEALYKAEQQQNKKPFYAQNEILLLGPGAARNVTPYLSYFADENAARPNLAAFLTPLTAEEVEGLGVDKHEVVVAYDVGDSVMITDGPLTSFVGVVDALDIDKNKVRVVVSMFGRETPVELELDQVETLDE